MPLSTSVWTSGVPDHPLIAPLLQPPVIEREIYNIVQNANSPNIFAILRDALKLANPATSVAEIISITEAIYNGGMFWAAGPNASHHTYDTTPIYNFVALAGRETRPFSTSQV